MFITIPIFSLERQEKGGRHDGHEQVGCGQDVRRNRERNWGVLQSYNCRYGHDKKSW